MKIIKILSIIALTSLSISSCGVGNEPSYETFGTRGLFLAVTETDHYTTSFFECGDATFKVIFGDQAQYSLADFRLNAYSTQGLLQVEKLKYEINDDNLKFKGENITPLFNGSSAPYTINNFDGKIYKGKNISMFFHTVIDLGDYIVSTPYKEYVLSGQTKVIESEAEIPMPQLFDTPIYHITVYPNKSKADLEIKGAKFHEKMPALDMVFPDLDFRISGTEGFELESESLTPTIGGKPFPNYQVTEAYLNFKNDATVPSTFRFNLYNEKLGSYQVIATLNY